jgi:hypothetical protein
VGVGVGVGKLTARARATPVSCGGSGRNSPTGEESYERLEREAVPACRCA